jgi:hypothetical protein
MEKIINDFTINIATANGTGSQSANLILLNSLFRMGTHVSGKNLFPSNIAGLPTWYIVRVSDHGYQEQVIYELQQFKKSGNPIKAIAIQGREALCPQQKNDDELKKSNWSEKSKICKSKTLELA